MRVFVTGGSGFLGRALLRQLDRHDIVAPTRSVCDLRCGMEVEHCIESSKPDVLVHLAATVGGIGANDAEPGAFFYDNLTMGVNVIEAARLAGVARIIVVGTCCSYPEHAPNPLRTEDIWGGLPHLTNRPYGLAKRALLGMLEAYERQYGTQWAYLIPANLYGPGDNFDTQTGHVIPAMIARFAAGGPVTLWGTGRPEREFLYVEDAARAISLAIDDRLVGAWNIGSGETCSIEHLARQIAYHVYDACFDGNVRWDHDQPDGQSSRVLDGRPFIERTGWGTWTGRDDGLRATVKSYLTKTRSSGTLVSTTE